MKNIYEKPILEVIIFTYDVLTASGDVTGTGETEVPVDEWFD